MYPFALMVYLFLFFILEQLLLFIFISICLRKGNKRHSKPGHGGYSVAMSGPPNCMYDKRSICFVLVSDGKVIHKTSPCVIGCIVEKTKVYDWNAFKVSDIMKNNIQFGYQLITNTKTKVVNVITKNQYRIQLIPNKLTVQLYLYMKGIRGTKDGYIASLVTVHTNHTSTNDELEIIWKCGKKKQRSSQQLQKYFVAQIKAQGLGFKDLFTKDDVENAGGDIQVTVNIIANNPSQSFNTKKTANDRNNLSRKRRAVIEEKSNEESIPTVAPRKKRRLNEDDTHC